MNEFLNTIFNRKSVRHYTGALVSKELLEILVKAGMSAPSSRNLQPWYFIIVTEPMLLEKLSESLPYAKMLQNAGAAIVVCGSPDKSDIELEQYWVQDCSAATQNILLAAESLGLGAVWTGVFPRKERVDIVRNCLNIPTDIIPLNVIPIGFPTGEDKPKIKFKSDRIQWNSF